MNNFFTFLSTCLVFSVGFSQGIIVNEVSNGPSGGSGAKEAVELLVIGSTAAPTAAVDLRGWIMDDNNGSFQSGTGTGVAPGHFRIAAGCTALSAVLPGALVVIYNANDRDPAIPADDPTDSNLDNVYVIPSTNACVEVCTTMPNGSNVAYSPCTYVATTLTGASSWNAIALANTGDAIQVRRPDFSFYHGLCYGSLTAPFPAFPASLGGGASFNVAPGSGTGRTYIMSCGSYTSSANYSSTTVASSTLGAPNSVQNTIMIDNMRANNFDYGNPSDPNNCVAVAFPITLSYFEVQAHNNENLVRYAVAGIEGQYTLQVQKSTDGFNFRDLAQAQTIATIGAWEFMDSQPSNETFYRLEIRDIEGLNVYSEVKTILRQNELSLSIYPNPTQNNLFVGINQTLDTGGELNLFDEMGRNVLHQLAAAGTNEQILDLQNLVGGVYTLKFSCRGRVISQKVLKY